MTFNEFDKLLEDIFTILDYTSNDFPDLKGLFYFGYLGRLFGNPQKREELSETIDKSILNEKNSLHIIKKYFSQETLLNEYEDTLIAYTEDFIYSFRDSLSQEKINEVDKILQNL